MSESEPAFRTGEALAGRAGAFVVDFVLLAVVSGVLWTGFTLLQVVTARVLGAGGTSGELSLGVLLVVRVAMWLVVGLAVFGYFAYLTAGDGQTLGKRFTDVAVVADDGSPVDRRGAAIRAAVLLVPMPVLAVLNIVGTVYGFVIGLPLVFAWVLVEAVVMYLTDDHWRLGDWLASTRVVPAEERA